MSKIKKMVECDTKFVSLLQVVKSRGAPQEGQKEEVEEKQAVSLF